MSLSKDILVPLVPESEIIQVTGTLRMDPCTQRIQGSKSAQSKSWESRPTWRLRTGGLRKWHVQLGRCDASLTPGSSPVLLGQPG